MAARAERAVVVLSANEERYVNLHSLCQQEGNVTVRWLSDPLELTHFIQTKGDTAPLAPHSTALILDLTIPSTTVSQVVTQSGHKTIPQVSTIAVESAHLDWYTVAIVSLVQISRTFPCLVISDYSQLRRILAQLDITVVGQIASDASATVWRTGLRVLLAHLAAIQTQIECVGSNHSQVNTRTYSYIYLRPDLQLDLDRACLYNAGAPVALTAREVTLLTILLRAPGRYLKSSYLAGQLTAAGAAFPVEEHSVEQAISALRRKMGEASQHNGVLRNRRGLGYAAFPVQQAEQAVELAWANHLDLSN